MAEEEKTPQQTKEPEAEAAPAIVDEKATSELSEKVDSLKIEENGASAEKKEAAAEGEDVPGGYLGEEDEELPVLDDDEIEENPAYIPKKGRYYMHDSRDEGGIDEFETKKSRADGSWSHDRYVERWQIPKSKKQIVAKYGFDIRDGETEEEAAERQQKEEANEDEDDTENSRQQQNRRGRGGQFQRGRGGPRRGRGDEGDDQYEGGNEDFEERAGERRQRGAGRPAMVRNVRGGRGTYTTTRGGRGARNFDRPPRNFEGRDEGERTRGGHDGEEMMENHRRGATRGTVRGFNAQPPRQFTRTFSASRGGGGGGPRHSSDSREGENGNHREAFEERRAPGGYLSNRARGGRGAFRGPSNRGGGGFSGDFRGNAGPKRYSMQRHDDPPPPRHFPGGSPDVVYFDAGAAPPPQPGPVVYFDTAKQQQQPRQLPPREKKIIEIRNPN